jgi:hypothetical protein
MRIWTNLPKGPARRELDCEDLGLAFCENVMVERTIGQVWSQIVVSSLSPPPLCFVAAVALSQTADCFV